ncbi:MAG TPA: kelch repeat-containing protein [Acidimicrobiales bacterium]|nr:kelch repeat-containing protein [Acidimicrobiales bacterium]
MSTALAGDVGPGTWTPVAPMGEARSGHTATTLDGPQCRRTPPVPEYCGKVLVIGGASAAAGASAELYDPVARSWSAISEPAHARTGHTATLLDGPPCRVEPAPSYCGRVLVVGSSTTDKAELFDPAGGADPWLPAGRLGAPRQHHAAAPLMDGRVLVMGGVSTGASILSSAEIYDPTADAGAQWTAAADMLTPRSQFTATALDGADCHGSPPVPAWCGDVLVAGGDTAGVPGTGIDGAELFDATAEGGFGAWRPAAALTTARLNHTATLLGGGRVLVAGDGQSDFRAKTAEVFDPAVPPVDGALGEGSWVPTADLVESRRFHTATLLDGPACRSGAPPSSCGKVLLAGGSTTLAFRSSAELYDPASGAWVLTEPMGSPRRDGAASMLADGTVLVAGGANASSVTEGIASAEVFDATSLVKPPHVANVCVPDGAACRTPASGATTGGTAVRITGLALGDTTAVHFGGTAAFHFEVQSPTVVVATAPEHPAAGTVDVTVTAGGGTSARFPSATFTYEEEDISALEVTDVQPASGAAGEQTPVRIRGTGFFPGVTAVTFGDVAASDVVVISDTEVRASAPALAKGAVVVGVRTPAATSPPPGAVFTYGSGRWVDAGAARQARYLHVAVLIDGEPCRRAPPPAACGKVLVAGGTTDFVSGTTPSLRSAELYDPGTGETGSFDATGDMGAVAGRMDFTATLLDGPACRAAALPPYCGQVLVVGGRGRHDDPGLASAELYDPVEGLWKGVGSLQTGRMSHTATLLDDGRVLVVGGVPIEQRRSEPMSSAEIYDPATRSWTAVSSLDSCAGRPTSCRARANHTATLLADGRVLVVGGTGDGAGASLKPLASAQVYDPRLDEWSPVESLTTNRFSHTATMLDTPPCAPHCGWVLVAGGIASSDDSVFGEARPVYVQTAELFDPASGHWASAPLTVARGGHTATALSDGTVLVAGADPTFPSAAASTPGVPTDTAELFDPTVGSWRSATPMTQERGIHTATLLDGLKCRGPAPPATWCGTVLVVGGAAAGGNGPPALASAERYVPSPDLDAVTPSSGASAGGEAIELSGHGFSDATTITFGGVPAAAVTVKSSQRVAAVTPKHTRGMLQIEVLNPGGSSATTPPALAHRFSFEISNPPPAITDLAARVVDGSDVELTFSAPPSDGDLGPPARAFVIKQAEAPIEDNDAFERARTLCDPCREYILPAAVGDHLSLTVPGLPPGRTHHFAIRAVNEADMMGDLSNPASATLADSGECGASPAPGPGRAVYPAGYSIVGVPGGSGVAAQSPLYGWFDQGAGGNYSIEGGQTPVSGGRGYYAWFACPTAVELRPASPSASFGLGAYHATLVGNPSDRPVNVTGHDYAARWDPMLDGGTGGYRVSGYREPQRLAVGEGIWVFSFTDTTVRIGP